MDDWTFEFPEVLQRMDYADRIPPDQRRVVRIDAREAVERYLREMNLGMEYERFVQSDANAGEPNRITRGNLEAAKLIHSMGWSYEGLSELVDQEIEELRSIPLQADFFETREYDRHAIDALLRLWRYRGVQVANATKFLYQKRRWLIPILDSYARQALGAAWTRGENTAGYREAFRIGFVQARRVYHHEGNAALIDRVLSWLDQDQALSQGLHCSRVRVLDMLAWVTIES